MKANKKVEDQVKILFVCTGNTCRSPMAERILRFRLSTCSQVDVKSAGLFAMPGLPASETAILCLQEKGIDLNNHSSQILLPELIDEATMVLVMTEHHRTIATQKFPEHREKIHVLTSFGEEKKDIPDPIGGPLDYYRHTCDMMESGIADFILYLKDKKYI